MTERQKPGEEIGLRGPFPRNVRLGVDGRGSLYSDVGDELNILSLWLETEKNRDRIPMATFKHIYIRESAGQNYYLTRITSSGEVVEFKYNSEGYVYDPKISTLSEEIAKKRLQNIVIRENHSGKREAVELVLTKHGKFTNDSERALQMPESIIQQEFEELFDAYKNPPKK
jgi:hypothetical protein